MPPDLVGVTEKAKGPKKNKHISLSMSDGGRAPYARGLIRIELWLALWLT